MNSHTAEVPHFAESEPAAVLHKSLKHLRKVARRSAGEWLRETLGIKAETKGEVRETQRAAAAAACKSGIINKKEEDGRRRRR